MIVFDYHIGRAVPGDFPDSHQEPDGWEYKRVPDVSADNLVYLLKRVALLENRVAVLEQLYTKAPRKDDD